VKKRAILQQSCSVLGNIQMGEVAIIIAKSIVTKPVKAYTKGVVFLQVLDYSGR